MVKDHSDTERGNPLPPHGLHFLIGSKGFFYMHHPIDTNHGALAGTRNSSNISEIIKKYFLMI